MDLLGTILGSVLVETGRASCSQVVGTIRFRSNVSALKAELSSLMKLQGKVNRDLETLEIRGRTLQVQLRRWLRDVEEIVAKATPIMKQRISCKLSREIVRILDEVKRLKKVGVSLIDIFSVDGSYERVEHVLGPSIHVQTEASRTLVKIIDSLRSDNVQKIGVWGMGGVGKTTLVRALNNKLRREVATQPFGVVIWATVSKELDLRRVQRQIAERLNIEIRMEETEERLAQRVHQRLERERNFLLILDDIWEHIDLDLVGIPPMEEHQGSKVILTSRSLEVCRNMRTDIDIKVECLGEEEAWQLFCHNAGEVARADRIRPIAKAVSRECGGLPLAIIATGTAMRGKKIDKLWKHALKELRRSMPCVQNIEKQIYKSLKLSYDSLEGKMRSCFLYCSLFPEDYSIEVSELVRCWIAEGFIDDQNNIEQSMNEGITLIENLKDSCLLEDGACDDGTVKMHDVVRDFAIWIMSCSSSSDESQSLVMAGTGLREIPQEKFVPFVQRVSLMNNKLENLPDCMVKCAEASTLLLQSNFHLHEIPNGFLLAFPALRILNLSGTRINSLPLSLCQLHNLRSLILRGCYYLHELPSLEALVKLQLLDLCATHVSELPRGLEALKSLKQLDLSRTHYLQTIPAGIIFQLSGLEILDMTLSHYHWNIHREQAEEEGQATFEEIGCLNNLLVLSIRLMRIPFLSSENESWIKKLKKFQLFIGPTANSLPTIHDKRRVTISSLNVSEASIGWLLATATSLVLYHCWGVNEMLENLVIDSTSSFKGLKILTIESFGSNLRPIGGCAAQLDLLPNLEQLHLRYVNLESTRELVGHLGLRFEMLKLIEISRCPKLRCLLSVGNFICFLPNLQVIQVSFCNRLEELFNYSPELVPSSAEPVVPNLRKIKLKNLPRLRRLCSAEETWGCLEQVEVIKCNLLRNLPISTENADRIKQIRGESHWWNNLSWEDSTTKSILQPRFESA